LRETAGLPSSITFSTSYTEIGSAERGSGLRSPNDAIHALIDVSSYPADTEVSWVRSRVVCAKCGARNNKIDVRPNWKEQPVGESLTGKVWR
jgi:hypothetical protein